MLPAGCETTGKVSKKRERGERKENKLVRVVRRKRRHRPGRGRMKKGRTKKINLSYKGVCPKLTFHSGRFAKLGSRAVVLPASKSTTRSHRSKGVLEKRRKRMKMRVLKLN